VTSVDWIDVAASTPLTNLKAQTNIGYGDLVGLVVDEALRPPHGVEISDGSEDFVYALDIGNGKEERLLSELSRDATSERGYIFIKGDAVYGGVLTVQGRGDRQIDTSLAATFTNTMHGLDAADEHAPNIVRVTVHPREVDPAATTVLFSMTQRQPIPPGETRVIEVDYRDPADPSVQVGGTAMVTPVASTDYTMNVASDGSGADLTSSVTIAETGDDLGGTAARLTVTNTHGTLVGWFLTQLRGKGIYHENPVTIPAENSADVRKNGPSAQDLDLPYGTNADFAYDVARNLLELFETAQVRTLTFIANDSDALMTQALAREPGDRIGIVETMTGATTVIDGSDAERGYFINQIELTVTEGGLIVCKWTLAPSLATGPAWVLGEAGASELDESTVLGL
jgi:hypothetical protein